MPSDPFTSDIVPRRRRAALVGALALLAAGLMPVRVSASDASQAAILGLGALAVVSGLPPLLRWRSDRRDATLRRRVTEMSDRELEGAAWSWLWSGDRFVPDTVRMHMRARLNRLYRDSDAGERRALLRALVTQLQSQASSPVHRIRVWTLNVGSGLIAVGFIGIWTLLYLLIWGIDTGAFGGLEDRAGRAQIGEFVYLAINGAVASVPADIPAQSQVAHMAIATEFVFGALLLANFAAPLIAELRGAERRPGRTPRAHRAPGT
jgi:hypothetical protein